jgi:GNAT superfamily N-acetyltransferase
MQRRLAVITGDLPAGFDILCAEARLEGHRFLDRLALDWAAGTMRFEGRGERLLAAFVGRGLAGIGGFTIEPAVAGALRMRRFYVGPANRRAGVGRLLASSLLENASRFTEIVTVNAQAPSFPFWESLGFERIMREGLTHAGAPKSLRLGIGS